MRKAALPIPYIIALIFGIVILAVLGYWLYSQSGKTIGKGASTECDALRSTFCQQWSITSYKIKPSMTFPGGCSEPKDENGCKTLIGEKCSSTSVGDCIGKSVGDSCIYEDDFGDLLSGTCRIISGDRCGCGV